MAMTRSRPLTPVERWYRLRSEIVRLDADVHLTFAGGYVRAVTIDKVLDAMNRVEKIRIGSEVRRKRNMKRGA
jgi:hypothetical protein